MSRVFGLGINWPGLDATTSDEDDSSRRHLVWRSRTLLAKHMRVVRQLSIPCVHMLLLACVSLPPIPSGFKNLDLHKIKKTFLSFSFA